MCGIVGVCGHKGAIQPTFLGLFALQHRGQEAAGFVTASMGKLHGRTALGLVGDSFTEEVLSRLPGETAVGHVRYATAGDGDLKNAQPLVFETVHGPLAIAHNGTLTNAMTLRRKFERQGAIFRTTTDSEVIVHLIARHPGPLEEALPAALKQIEGAYSLLILAPEKLFAVRDPQGFRPLMLGRLGGSPVFASETTAFDLMGAEFDRELEGGEMLVVEGSSMKSLKPFARAQEAAACVFELIYFARPDSMVFGRGVQAARRALGRELAIQMRPVKADVIVPVPDSGFSAALGLSQESGIPLEMGLIRSRYIGRTFIQPAQVLRDNSVNLKLSPVKEALRGKRIVLVDDSIVRGTTSRRLCRSLRKAGVAEIHMAISSPPIVSPCYYGIDTPRKSELIAANKTVDEIRKFLGVDSLTYLSLEGTLRACRGQTQGTFCSACFTGEYPTRLRDLQAEEEGAAS